MTVIVARRDDNFSRSLRNANIEVINLELVATEVAEDLTEFENSVSRLGEYDGILFTSPVAAEVFTDHVEPSLKPTLYALGRRASKVLIDAGFTVKTIPEANTAEEMLAAFGNHEFVGKRVLFVRGEQSLRTIPEKLGAIATVDEAPVYRTIEIEPVESIATNIRGRLAREEIKWICFFSPSAVQAFDEQFDMCDANVAAIGETTAARARESGFNVEFVASRATNDIFASELIERIKGV